MANEAQTETAQANTDAAAAMASGKAGEPEPTILTGGEKDETTKTAPAAETSGKEGAAPAAPKAPEKYEAFSLPEGVTLGEEYLAKFSESAKSANLSQEQAQEFMDRFSEQIGSEISRIQSEWGETQKTWVRELKEDKEFGGQNYNATVEQANRALKRFGSPELTDLLMKSGFGNSSALVKMLAKIDKATAEDKSVDGAPNSAEKKSFASVFDHPSNYK